jgi:cytochrome bd-type quinol oxidase subunit 2
MDMIYDGHWLPVAFAALMGLSILAYVILDGYDLGVGMLMADADARQRDMMIGSIGPFWDANETWLVLAVGLLLVAFPVAHGAILSALYLPVALLLLGLILRGVSFEFRAKRWFDWPGLLMLAPLPLLTALLLFGLARMLMRMPLAEDAWHHIPFWGATGLFLLFFTGLAWSFFPYVVPERLTIWESASAPESLTIILAGALFVLPVIVLYTVFAWRVFGGKARDLTYY